MTTTKARKNATPKKKPKLLSETALRLLKILRDWNVLVEKSVGSIAQRLWPKTRLGHARPCGHMLSVLRKRGLVNPQNGLTAAGRKALEK